VVTGGAMPVFRRPEPPGSSNIENCPTRNRTEQGSEDPRAPGNPLAGTRNRRDPDKWRPLTRITRKFSGLGEKLGHSTLANIPEEYRSPYVPDNRLTNGFSLPARTGKENREPGHGRIVMRSAGGGESGECVPR
jgi:hypothetical protein